MKGTPRRSKNFDENDHRCKLAGKEMDCAKIFTPVPTDYGMCCAFNPRTILRYQSMFADDEILISPGKKIAMKQLGRTHMHAWSGICK